MLGIAGELARRVAPATLKAGALRSVLGEAMAGGVALAVLRPFVDWRGSRIPDMESAFPWPCTA